MDLLCNYTDKELAKIYRSAKTSSTLLQFTYEEMDKRGLLKEKKGLGYPKEKNKRICDYIDGEITSPINNKLIDCPFCGENYPYLRAGFISCNRFAVSCHNCHAHGPVFTYPDYDDEGKPLEEWNEILTREAIEAWNNLSRK